MVCSKLVLWTNPFTLTVNCPLTIVTTKDIFVPNTLAAIPSEIG